MTSHDSTEPCTRRIDGVLPWDEAYMRMAEDIARFRSKDPRTQVGAFIADAEHHPLSLGYNGAPKGWDDDDFPWGRDGGATTSKYKFVVHAERNAILNAPAGTSSLRGSTLYVSLFPCSECAKEIVQSGISRLVYRDRREGEDTEAADMILRHASILCEQLPSLQES